ncbi:MAG: S-layer homology domain-containing protein [Veillonella sp.]|uniref:S-layer homology domain-containing protein n=1 Tax=Veillonella sp. TaxID=1926307 RepID=UPI0025CC1ED9|nr:S-layer homology domain-containing protein [Veillonella sp.]MBE6080148.1 S-layer homology domain-containing protein [Veillonella sp.]
MSKFFTTKSLAVLCALVLTGAVAQAGTVTVTGPDDAVSDDYTPVRVVKESASNETTFSPLALKYYTTNNTAQAVGEAAKAAEAEKAAEVKADSVVTATATPEEVPVTKASANQTAAAKSNQATANTKASANSQVTPGTYKPFKFDMATTAPTVFEEARKYTFKDIPADYWAAKAIAVMTNQQLISGYNDNTFRPEKPISREEVASLFSNLISGESSVMLSSSFKDITSDRWSANAIERVAQLNLISGYGDNTYRPEQFMSRQEFAVVADNYIHYLGYTTDDQTAIDAVHYNDQKFIAPWAQTAVRELAALGFLHYQPRLLFNPEKYITRAEATEIMYRVTNSDAAVALREKILHQQVENKMLTLIEQTFGKEYVFRTHGAMYWQDNKLVAALKDENDVKKLGAALAFSKDSDLRSNTQVTTGVMNEIELGKLQTEAAYYYNQQEPTGSILSAVPNKNASGLILVVDQLNPGSNKAMAKKFGSKVTITVAEEAN